MPRS
ncbi:UNVERIFIED_CONTAM: hypothetical protein GTU68_046467 [Idotea baltica]|jgi:hypothetical protein